MAQVEDGTVPTNTTESNAAPIAAAEATTEPPAAPVIAAAAAHEVDVDDGTDSALGEEIQTDTTSLTSTIYRHRQELGRTYHAFRGGENDYWGPNDEQQNDQLDIGHHMLLLLLDNKLYLSPLKKDKCRRVLDAGCGTGLWSIDFADAHPEAEVTGVDLSPIQPSFIPPNCRFVIDDITSPWEYPRDHFDFVHIRCLYGSVSDWPGLFQQAFTHISPGGWIESSEIDIDFISDDGTLESDPEHVMLRWSKIFKSAGVKMGKTFDVEAEKWIPEAGFVDVQSRSYKIPVGMWPKNKAMKQIGMWNYHYCYEGCEGWALYLCTRILGWRVEECQVLVAEFRNALKDKKIHAYYRLNVVWGRKPLPGEKPT